MGLRAGLTIDAVLRLGYLFKFFKWFMPLDLHKGALEILFVAMKLGILTFPLGYFVILFSENCSFGNFLQNNKL